MTFSTIFARRPQKKERCHPPLPVSGVYYTRPNPKNGRRRTQLPPSPARVLDEGVALVQWRDDRARPPPAGRLRGCDDALSVARRPNQSLGDHGPEVSVRSRRFRFRIRDELRLGERGDDVFAGRHRGLRGFRVVRERGRRGPAAGQAEETPPEADERAESDPADQNQKTPSHEGQRQGAQSDAHVERGPGQTPVRFADVPGRREADENRNAQVRAQLHLGAVTHPPSGRVHRTIAVGPKPTVDAHHGRRDGQHRPTRQQDHFVDGNVCARATEETRLRRVDRARNSAAAAAANPGDFDAREKVRHYGPLSRRLRLLRGAVNRPTSPPPPPPPPATAPGADRGQPRPRLPTGLQVVSREARRREPSPPARRTEDVVRAGGVPRRPVSGTIPLAATDRVAQPRPADLPLGRGPDVPRTDDVLLLRRPKTRVRFRIRPPLAAIFTVLARSADE